MSKLKQADFYRVKEGDTVTRMIGENTEFMKMKVVEVTDDLIKCIPETAPNWPKEDGWAFSRKTGAEEDHELGWGDKFGKTGTYLKAIE